MSDLNIVSVASCNKVSRYSIVAGSYRLPLLGKPVRILIIPLRDNNILKGVVAFYATAA